MEGRVPRGPTTLRVHPRRHDRHRARGRPGPLPGPLLPGRAVALLSRPRPQRRGAWPPPPAGSGPPPGSACSSPPPGSPGSASTAGRPTTTANPTSAGRSSSATPPGRPSSTATTGPASGPGCSEQGPLPAQRIEVPARRGSRSAGSAGNRSAGPTSTGLTAGSGCTGVCPPRRPPRGCGGVNIPAESLDDYITDEVLANAAVPAFMERLRANAGDREVTARRKAEKELVAAEAQPGAAPPRPRRRRTVPRELESGRTRAPRPRRDGRPGASRPVRHRRPGAARSSWTGPTSWPESGTG